MNENSGTIPGIALLVAIGFLVWLVISQLCKNGCEAPAPAPVTEKPFTKTRCDFTGFFASSIIEEEAKNGYRFDGRVNTPFCGEGGLSFSLRQ